MRPARNPDVSGKPCAICFAAAESFSHNVHRGMGGDPKRKRTDGLPMCGSGGTHDTTCHGLVSAGDITVKRDDDGQCWYLPTARAAAYLWGRNVACLPGAWSEVLYEGSDFDEIGAGA